MIRIKCVERTFPYPTLESDSPGMEGCSHSSLERENFTIECTQNLPGEEFGEDAGNPSCWVAPKINDLSPDDFANGLIGSGELVQIVSKDIEKEGDDPLSACRFVSAIEIAYESWIRRYLRNMFQEEALMTTRPTKKGLNNIDVFSEY